MVIVKCFYCGSAIKLRNDLQKVNSGREVHETQSGACIYCQVEYKLDFKQRGKSIALLSLNTPKQRLGSGLRLDEKTLWKGGL